MKPTLRRILCPLALAAIAMLILSAPALLRQSASIPGLEAEERTLLRIWVTNAPGGAQAWLTAALRQWEKQHPGVMTYLRTVSAETLTDPDTVLPDVVLYMPGDLTAPQTLFTPLSGALTAKEALLRCGRWQGQQYGLPLCWGAWVLAIDSALEPGSALTPAPTTLLGKPAATQPSASQTPGYPLAAASQSACALQSPGGAALLALTCLLEQTERPPLPEDFAHLSSSQVYSAFQARKAATAMLTTGQVTAFTSLTSAGKGFPFRVITPSEVVTDQVWLASLTPGAPQEAAALLAHLTSADAQQLLSRQGLYTVRDDLVLYAAGTSAEVERAGMRALSAINAYIPSTDAAAAAWQAFQGALGFSEALLPLM
ncbi:MAG: hypothetical protein IJZ74_03390 [Clostridia bacterium]|nr:hypothetical protein [Clostridia bacterium]